MGRLLPVGWNGCGGAVVAEWGNTAAKTALASVRKSLLSALIGNAVERKELDLSQTIGSLGIDDNEPSLTLEEKTATVRDLLQARSGVYHAALYETREAAAARPPRHSHKPGASWYYNNWDFNTLGTIYERAVRSSIFDAFEREIARPIGMQDYQPSDGQYVTGGASVYPAYPFKMSARDLARFALLPQEGSVAGPAGHSAGVGRREHKRVLTFGIWARLRLSVWTGPISNGVAPSVNFPDGTFFAAGTGGQYAFVIPVHDLVVVHRGPHIEGGLANFRTIGRLLWLILDAGKFPEIGPDASLEAARGMRVGGEVLSRTLTGKTLLYGEAATAGPYRVRLNADGTAAFLRGRELTQGDTGTWSIRDDKYCREWKTIEPRQMCMAAAVSGSNLQLFDPMGLMLIEARVVDE